MSVSSSRSQRALCRLLGFPGILEVKTIVVILDAFICLFTVDVGTDDAKAMMRKTATTLSRVKAMTPKGPGGHSNPVSLKNVLDKVGEMRDFIKPQLLRTHHFIFRVTSC